MPAIFFALISYIGWGFSDFFVTISARKLSAYSATFWTLLISSIMMSFIVPFFQTDLHNLTLSTFLLTFFLGFILVTGIVAFREALIQGSSPLIVTIAASFGAVTTLLSLIFFRETLTIVQVSSIVVIFIGIALSMLDFRELRKRKLSIDKSMILALFAMVTWGIYFAFIKIPVREIGWFLPNYISIAALTPFMYLFMRFRNLTLVHPNRNDAFLPLLLAIVLARGAEISFNAGISLGFTSIVAPIASANPTLFVVIAAIFLKDPITRQQILGIVTTLVGIVLLSIFSV